MIVTTVPAPVARLLQLDDEGTRQNIYKATQDVWKNGTVILTLPLAGARKLLGDVILIARDGHWSATAGEQRAAETYRPKLARLIVDAEAPQ